MDENRIKFIIREFDFGIKWASDADGRLTALGKWLDDPKRESDLIRLYMRWHAFWQEVERPYLEAKERKEKRERLLAGMSDEEARSVFRDFLEETWGLDAQECDRFEFSFRDMWAAKAYAFTHDPNYIFRAVASEYLSNPEDTKDARKVFMRYYSDLQSLWDIRRLRELNQGRPKGINHLDQLRHHIYGDDIN